VENHTPPTPQLKERSFVAGGIEFALLEAGPESGPLALCLHGFPDTAWTWRHLLPVLAEAGYHAVAPFLRGYAPSGLAPDGCYQTGALATDACALEEILRGESTSILIGHDWGSFAAYGAASLRPERFERVVAMATGPVPALASNFFSYDQLKRSFYVFVFQTPLAEMIVSADDYEFIDRLWADWSPGYDATWDIARVKESIGTPERLSAAIGYYRAMLGTSPHLEAYESAQMATAGVPPQPTLYMHGAEDGCIAVSSAAGVLDFLAEGSESIVVAGAGHFLHVERPDEVAANIMRFISS
jgi:pimeloyl-ACP methyl ester carboxylesterase